MFPDDSQPRSRWVWWVVGIVVAVALGGALAVGIWAISTNHAEAASARNIATQIQAERVRNIRESCEAQNQRHDYTIRTLDNLIAKAPVAQQARARDSRDSTVLLLEAIVPHRDCDALVRQQAPSG